MKILHLDIETAPNTVHVWGLWNVNVSIKQVLNSSHTLCWAAKWEGDKRVMFNSVQESSRKVMIREIYELINQADAVVHFNGNRFDMPTLNKEFVLLGMTPPATYRNIDLYSACKRAFRFPSFKLDYIVNELGIGGKVNHKGHQLWIECMRLAGVSEAEYLSAWRIMKRYNKQDVNITQALYRRILPWIQGHPNWNAYNDDGVTVCVNCGGDRIHRKAMHHTAVFMYKRYRCADCGKWMRGRKVQISDETKDSMLVSAI